MVNYFRAAIFWLSFVSLTLILFVWLVLVVSAYKLFRPSELSHGAHWVATVWGRAIVLFTPGWHYEVFGRENLPKPGSKPVVMVANHQSAADIWALYLTGAQFRWLSKAAVFKVPIIGTAMRWAGYVPIRREDRGSHGSAMQASAKWLREGVSMVFFPEGTRSENGRLKDFKLGAFRLAVESGVDILPLVLRGTRDMVQKKSGIPCPARLEIEVLPPVAHLPNESLDNYALRVQNLIGQRLESSPRSQSKVSARSPNGLDRQRI